MQPTEVEPAVASGQSVLGVHPLLEAGLRAFEREREGLLALGHAEKEWVAYHGDRRLGIAATDLELHEIWCVQGGGGRRGGFLPLAAACRPAGIRRLAGEG